MYLSLKANLGCLERPEILAVPFLGVPGSGGGMLHVLVTQKLEGKDRFFSYQNPAACVSLDCATTFIN